MRATKVSQLPVLEIVWPMKNSRKFRDLRDVSVRRTKLAGGAVGLSPSWVTLTGSALATCSPSGSASMYEA